MSSGSITNGGKTYTVSASTVYTAGTYDGFKAFDDSVSTGWRSKTDASNTYSQNSADTYLIFVGTGRTTLWGDGGSSRGEWLQVQVSAAIVLAKYNIVFDSTTPELAPRAWSILGSNDGVAWDLLTGFGDSFPGYRSDSSPRDFYPRAGVYSDGPLQWRAFTHFRLVVTMIGYTVGAVKEVQINEWRLYEGTAQLCPAGGYCPSSPAGSLVYCPANTYQANTGRTLSSDCLTCTSTNRPSGFTDPTGTLGATACSPCAAGTAGSDGTCASCSKGYIAGTTGLAS
jgi:hypothetical protein